LANVVSQIFIFLSITYMAICVYWSLFRLRLFNYYHLIPHQQTDPSSLMFCALYLGRLIPPLAYNYLTMIHNPDTAFWMLIGNMNVVPILGHGFNLYVPILLPVVIFFTLFNLYSRVASLLRIKRFQFSENINDDQIEEGGELLRRERSQRERMTKHDAMAQNYTPVAFRSRRRRDPSMLVEEEEDLESTRDIRRTRGGNGNGNGIDIQPLERGRDGGASSRGNNRPFSSFRFPSLARIFSKRGADTPTDLDAYVNELEQLASNVERERG